jgi:hypothetical protein
VGLGVRVGSARPLLQPVMVGGQRQDGDACRLDAARERCREALALLPPKVRLLEPSDAPVWPVERSPGLEQLRAHVSAEVGNGAGLTGQAVR